MLIEQIIKEYKAQEIMLYDKYPLKVYAVGSLRNLESLASNIGDLRGTTVGKQIWFWDAMKAAHNDVQETLRPYQDEYGNIGTYDLYVSKGEPDLHGAEWEGHMNQVPGTDLHIGVYSPYKRHNDPYEDGTMHWKDVNQHLNLQRMLKVNEDTQILDEARMAPLFHWTKLERFFKIMDEDTLKGRSQMSKYNMKKTPPSISFTRDYRRQFVPGQVGTTIGLIIDQQKLNQNYKIEPAVNTVKDVSYDDLRDHDKETVDKARAGDEDAIRMAKSVAFNGTFLIDIVKGSAGRVNRFESEERVYAEEIPNISKYITGIALNTMAQRKDGDLSVGKEYFPGFQFIQLFNPYRERGFDMRNEMLAQAEKNGWYFFFGGKKYTPQEIKSSMIKYYSFRKKDYSGWVDMIRTWGYHPRMV